ncbi:hypothetical protein DH2020_034378 [Rehmannia glutinosa]|uniref:Peptidase S54 rhomboid domain-containing protein n=1 Tax=Rehmannia glutinosa TaxID=99300 RepID=A0ABR0VCW6_REHGL
MSTAAVALRLSDALHRRFHLGFLLRSSLKSISHLGDVPLWKDMCHERALQFTGFNCFQWSFNALSSTLMSLSFFNGEESGSNKDFGKPQSRTSRRDLFKEGNGLIFFLLLMSCEVYIAQYVSDGKLLFWGAKINGLISKGQLWRLVTSSFLHANIGHLLVNCYSLNSTGPSVENICGPKRYLTIYITSAIASSAMSYWFCTSPAVGASGAIFGLVGSFAMFVLRHRGMVKGTEGDLKHIAQVIVLNMAIGLLSQGIDNWGHETSQVKARKLQEYSVSFGPTCKFVNLSFENGLVIAIDVSSLASSA